MWSAGFLFLLLFLSCCDGLYTSGPVSQSKLFLHEAAFVVEFYHGNRKRNENIWFQVFHKSRDLSTLLCILLPLCTKWLLFLLCPFLFVHSTKYLDLPGICCCFTLGIHCPAHYIYVCVPSRIAPTRHFLIHYLT